MKVIGYFILVLFLFSCNSEPNEETDGDSKIEINPAAKGFNLNGSDSAAIRIADSVMVAMGGRKAWDELRYVSWNFFGFRDLVWDKQTGRVRIDMPKDSMVFLVNITSDKGQVFRNGEEIVQEDSVKKYVDRGISIWNNDSYWLFMPFKLKDSGVTLKYAGQDTTMKGEAAYVLELTFAEVGDTPNNKYEVYVDQNDYLVKQWSYYRLNQQDSASAVWPWDNYKSYNGVLLSADRSDKRGPKDVKVFDQLSDSVFESPSKPAL